MSPTGSVGAPVDLAGQATRRARLAAVVGRLLVAEPGADAAELVRGVPGLEPLGRPDPDLASVYERLLLREVPVFESVFLGDDGQRGGPVVDDVVAAYRRHDFAEAGGWRVASPDHLGLELRFLGHLAAREAAAWAADRPEEAASLVEAQREFLALHVGQWAQVALDAVARRAGSGPYTEVADAAGRLLAETADRLRPAPHHPGMPEVAADPAPARLGPARLARWLLAPARAGVFLGVDDLAAAAAALGMPWRPSDPRSRFRHVLEAAADADALGAVVGALRPTVEEAVARYASREADRDGDRRVWTRWRLQAEVTLALIDRVGAERSPRERAADAGPLVVEVTGPADSWADGALLVRRLAGLGARVSVSVVPAHPLASFLGPVLAAGADEVLVSDPAVSLIGVADGGGPSDRESRHLTGADVVVRFVEGARAEGTRIEGEGRWRRDVERALAEAGSLRDPEMF